MASSCGGDIICIAVVFIMLMNTSSSSSEGSGSPKVEVALYYETLCPYCSNFMVNHLPQVFHNQLIDIINLRLLPYGNAKIGPSPQNTITCQHGPYECLLNTVEACALHVWPDVKRHYTFIYCIELLVFEGKYTEWESCFGETGFDSKPIEDCYKSGLGKQLELRYANETNNIQPPHRYVPWVTVNGQPLYEDYQNITTYICKAYVGNPVPKACKDLPPQIVTKAEDSQSKQVCHAEVTTSLSSSSKTESTNIKSPATSWRRQMKMATSA